MFDTLPLFHLFGLPVYGYGLLLSIGLLIALLILRSTFTATFNAPQAVFPYVSCVLPCGFIGARLVYCIIRSSFLLPEFGWTFFFHFWVGGYSMLGIS